MDKIIGKLRPLRTGIPEANSPTAPHEEHFQSAVPPGAHWSAERFSASVRGIILQHFLQIQRVGSSIPIFLSSSSFIVRIYMPSSNRVQGASRNTRKASCEHRSSSEK